MFGQNRWLSKREILLSSQKVAAPSYVTKWYDQFGLNDLAPVNGQNHPQLLSKNHLTLVNSKPTLTFDANAGLTAAPVKASFDDIALSFVVSYHSLLPSTLFNLTGSSKDRFMSHLPWVDGVVYFDTNSVEIDSWRTSAVLPVPLGQTFIATYMRNTEKFSILINGTEIASAPAPKERVNTLGNLVINSGNGVSQGGVVNIAELVISDAISAADVIKSQQRYFKL
ncbi:MAG: hypothetical protein ACRCZ9_00440 [Fusobacteriaceae bacterium]